MNETKKWYSLRLTVVPESTEAVEFALNSLDALGTEIDFMKKPDAEVCVVGYFDRFPDDEAIRDELHYALRSYDLNAEAIMSIERGEIENTDWLAEWKKHWKPTRVGRFVVTPPWSDVDQEEGIIIRIEPNMAFGTGTHETTKLCLNAIDELYTPGDSFLDVGTGTGLLAIAAAKLTNSDLQTGGRSIAGCDIDPEAVKIARENAQLNGVSDQIEFETGTIDGNTTKFDFVCANLTLDVIQPILPKLLEASKKYLVLSGILNEQENEILKTLAASPEGEGREVRTDGEWIAIAVRR